MVPGEQMGPCGFSQKDRVMSLNSSISSGRSRGAGELQDGKYVEKGGLN